MITGKSIEIVTHCWAELHPHFAEALRYQLCSIVNSMGRMSKFRVSVCYAPSDVRTVEVLRQCSTSLLGTALATYEMPKEFLGRRCIGRNEIAKRTEADIVWFTDVDHVFGGSCLHELSVLPWPGDAAMVYPQDIWISGNHATGDATLLRGPEFAVHGVDASEFTAKHYSRAIGGVQIVRGDFARKHGYLDCYVRWQSPTDTPFGDFRDDIAYRKFCGRNGGVVPINLPNLFRLRHSTTTHKCK